MQAYLVESDSVFADSICIAIFRSVPPVSHIQDPTFIGFNRSILISL